MNIEEPVSKIIEKLQGWLDTFITMLPNMAVAIILLIIFFVLASLGKKAFKKLFRKSSRNKALENLFASVTYYAILGLGFFIILSVLKLNQAVASLLAGIGVAGLALGFAFQNIAANFVSGIILAFRAPFRIGDIVEVNSIMGEVNNTDLRVTVLKTFQGQLVHVPNKDVLQNPIVNYSALGKRRIDLSVGISYAEDLEQVEDVVRSAVNGLDGIIEKENTIFDYHEFGDSSINFYIRFWITYPDQPGFLKQRKEAIVAIKKAFDKENITIPFPIRTLDFGIKGGSQLEQQHLQLAANGSES